MKFVKDEFDSNIFQKNVYKMTLDLHTTKEQVFLCLNSESTDIVFSFCPVASNQMRILEEFEFRCISIRNTYRYFISQVTPINLEAGYSVEEFTNQEIPPELVVQLANVIGSETRYFKDELIDRSTAQQIYVNWIHNSLYKKFSSRTFIAKYDKKIIGICTTKNKDKEGEIDLIGVIPEYQSKKIGKALISNALQYLLKNNPTHISVITAGENLSANILFQKNSFVIHNVELVYHKHIMKDKQ